MGAGRHAAQGGAPVAALGPARASRGCLARRTHPFGRRRDGKAGASPPHSAALATGGGRRIRRNGGAAHAVSRRRCRGAPACCRAGAGTATRAQRAATRRWLKVVATLVETLLLVVEVFEQEGVAYALAGGMAANLYRSEVRATEDLDLSVKIRPPQGVALADALRARGWTVTPIAKGVHQLRLTRPGYPRVDCLVAGTDFEEAAIDRALEMAVAGRRLRVLCPEDLIVLKLVAGRARDFDAAGDMINTLGDRLDSAYIRGWLEQFGVESRWQQALEEAERQRGQA
ncbi:MAG: hypothetical protein D6760_04280 [Deltaproteobacteria bacterium]|nr:MAG: hypothetical protein D6760_04280 [Deltaproteobacteria bacterium]